MHQPKSPRWIVEEYKVRQNNSSKILEAMRQITDLVNGDVVVPLPELNANEKPAVANLTREAIDQLGMRVASTMPNLVCPPLKPRSMSSQEEAERRRMGILTYWAANRIRRQLRRRARFLAAYGMSVVAMRPDVKQQIPVWELRSPLTTFPSPTEWYDDCHPCDVIFAYRKTLRWVKENYEEQYAQLTAGITDPRPSDPVEIIEYRDAHEVVMIAAAIKTDWQVGAFDQIAGQKIVELERIPNRAGICTVSTPTRITLDRLAGQFDGVVGIHQAQSRLMALELIAAEKHVFPDLVLVPSGPNVTPSIVGGQWKDGRTGEINIVKNGQVDVIQISPGVQTIPIMDVLERHQRHDAGIPPQWGGEVPTNIRTGRAGEVTMSATVDFRVQELQEILADALTIENKIGIRIARAYFGDRPRSFHISLPQGIKGPKDFTPNKDFTTEETVVEYPMPGADVNGIVVALGQRVGLGLMARQTARRIDPLINDPDLEGDLVRTEALEAALMASLQQMAAAGQIPPVDMAYIERLHVEQNMPLYEAVEKAQERAQERQTQEVPEGDPASAPGLGPPGMGAEAPVQPTVPRPQGGDSLANLQMLLQGLAQPSSRSRGAAPVATAGAAANR